MPIFCHGCASLIHEWHYNYEYTPNHKKLYEIIFVRFVEMEMINMAFIAAVRLFFIARNSGDAEKRHISHSHITWRCRRTKYTYMQLFWLSGIDSTQHTHTHIHAKNNSRTNSYCVLSMNEDRVDGEKNFSIWCTSIFIAQSKTTRTTVVEWRFHFHLIDFHL